MKSARDKLRSIVEDAKGDDLERAQCTFENCDKKEMKRFYGFSGKIC
jgi:hypothetical protein